MPNTTDNILLWGVSVQDISIWNDTPSMANLLSPVWVVTTQSTEGLNRTTSTIMVDSCSLFELWHHFDSAFGHQHSWFSSLWAPGSPWLHRAYPWSLFWGLHTQLELHCLLVFGLGVNDLLIVLVLWMRIVTRLTSFASGCHRWPSVYCSSETDLGTHLLPTSHDK